MAGEGAVCDRPSPRSLPCRGGIGEGGMGVVYRAHDEVLHRDVALKVVNKGAGLDASASQNLLHEARASSSLAHPNICTIYEVGETEGDLYIVMELVEGKSLCAMSGGRGTAGGVSPPIWRSDSQRTCPRSRQRHRSSGFKNCQYCCHFRWSGQSSRFRFSKTGRKRVVRGLHAVV